MTRPPLSIPHKVPVFQLWSIIDSDPSNQNDASTSSKIMKILKIPNAVEGNAVPVGKKFPVRMPATIEKRKVYRVLVRCSRQ